MTRRNTIQRDLVLDAVNRLKCHATADEVYNYISQNYPSIGKATVYRNLRLLADEKIITKVEIPGEPERFDHNRNSHHHIKCINCGRIFDVMIENPPDLKNNIVCNTETEILDYDIIFRGICFVCKNKEERL